MLWAFLKDGEMSLLIVEEVQGATEDDGAEESLDQR